MKSSQELNPRHVHDDDEDDGVGGGDYVIF
jgi:hypothetical protein